MIHHVSLPAADPRRVAHFLAGLMGGRTFPGPVPGAWMALAGDGHGTEIEVYPEGTALVPGPPGSPNRYAPAGPAAPTPFHLLLSVALEESQVLTAARREGWRAERHGRGVPGQRPAFEVLEVWLENRHLLEVAPPSLLPAYLGAMRISVLEGLRHQALAADRA